MPTEKQNECSPARLVQLVRQTLQDEGKAIGEVDLNALRSGAREMIKALGLTPTNFTEDVIDLDGHMAYHRRMGDA